MRESGEDYLETIYLLSRKQSDVHCSDVAAKLGFSKPSVTRAVGILRAAGFIGIDSEKHIMLTQAGFKKAEEIAERHKTITQFWVLNGVDAGIAEKDACRMEHDISEETFAAIKKIVEKSALNT
ncbi:MAG: metal-dependent transcriptional regulator [Firmicutes bacterium]|nr:metal-dependent transcriptional regulator [Bacillota bacterium]